MTRTHMLCAAAVLALAGTASAQSVITQWNFNNLASGQIINAPAPTTGRGAAIPLGMTNNYLYFTSPQRTGSVTMCDAPAAGASSDAGSSPNNCWRVRGSFDTTLANAGVGYSIFAPQFTQGAQFDISTVNYAGVTFSFDWFTTNQGVRNMQVQYSTNGGANWVSTGPILICLTNGWRNNQIVDLTGVPAADDNPNFKIRLVSVYDPTFSGPGAPTYTGASGGQYNNFSGNWRFDKVTLTGTAIRSVGPVCTGAVNPPAVCASGGPLTFSVTTTGGAAPASTGLTVTADLSPLALSGAQAFLDDGANGDAAAGDGVFTYVATVPGGRPLAAVNIVATVNDAQLRPSTTTIPVIVGDCGGNSASKVVISQTFAGGGNLGVLVSDDAPFNADYVELYNRSNQAVSMNGWSVQYASQASSGGFDSTGDRVLLSGVIQPGQYVLVRMSDPTPGFTALPTPDFAQLANFGGMGSTGGRVALVRSATLLGTNFSDSSIEDLVGYGAGAITFEGSAPAPTPVPSSSKAELRKLDGAQDSNQNFNDFAVGTPTPRNRANSGAFLAGAPSTSASAVCAGTDVTLSLTVSPSNTSTGIVATADVSSITGAPGTLTLRDNGTNGDQFANDGVYAAAYTVPAGAAQGNRTVSFTVTDAQGRSDASTAPLAVAQCSNSNAPVVISQVYGGGGNNFSGFSGDFAEIFNRSASAVDLTGWSFQSARISDAGFDSRIVLLSGVINPGEYRLIITNLVSMTGGTLPSPDFSPNPLFGMESSFGRVALVSTTNLLHAETNRADIVDIVGYGSASQTFEGVGPTATLGDVLVAVRKDGGCQDTNQNAIDFDVVLAITQPRNSGSSADLSCPPIGCPADFNGDGVTDPDDLADYIGAFFAVPPAPNSDFNNDGTTDPDDLADYIGAFFSSPC